MTKKIRLGFAVVIFFILLFLYLNHNLCYNEEVCQISLMRYCMPHETLKNIELMRKNGVDNYFHIKKAECDASFEDPDNIIPDEEFFDKYYNHNIDRLIKIIDVEKSLTHGKYIDLMTAIGDFQLDINHTYAYGHYNDNMSLLQLPTEIVCFDFQKNKGRTVTPHAQILYRPDIYDFEDEVYYASLRLMVKLFILCLMCLIPIIGMCYLEQFKEEGSVVTHGIFTGLLRS